MENIDADFDIFKVEKANKDYYKYNILDSAIYEFKAAAVQWTFGATALVLFRKDDVTERKFKDSIMKKYKDVKIQKIDLFDTEQCNQCFYYENRLLAQLLINSIRTPKNDRFMYHNLTGKLFYHLPSKKEKDHRRIGNSDIIRFLEIVIDPGMYLNLEHKTFRKYGYQTGNGLYVIDAKTGEFRKKLKSDINVITYKEGSVPHKHFTVKNFDITDYTHFRKSKMGIMAQFLKDVKENLSKYITIEIMEREDTQKFEIPKLEKRGITECEYGKILAKKGVVIVDENNSEKSQDMIKQLQEELKKYYGIEAVVGELSKTAYNIRIIHEEKYYEEKDLHDPHSDNLKGYIVQHIAEEADHPKKQKGAAPDIRKIVQELIIKGEVRDKVISIFDWKRLDSEKEWTFVLRKKIKPDFQEDTKHINHANKQAFCYFKYYRLKINNVGEMKFDTFCDNDSEESEEWNKICYAYDSAEDKHRGVKNHVEGLVYSDINNIHAILLTKEKTLPNIETLMNTLKQTDVKEKVSKEIVLNAINDFEIEHPEFNENITNWRNELSEKAGMITKGDLKKILNMRTGAASKFNRFLHENYNIWIFGEFRNRDFEATFQISNLLNIKYEYTTDDYLDGNAFVYYVGAKSQKPSYPNACCMRKVISFGDHLEYEELLPLMAVEFIRNNQYTVLPFPYKYLREYIEKY